MKLAAACILMALLLAGCISRYPMGLNREQWEALPPAQQAELQAKQYALDEGRRQADEARRIEQARLAAEQEQQALEAQQAEEAEKAQAEFEAQQAAMQQAEFEAQQAAAHQNLLHHSHSLVTCRNTARLPPDLAADQRDGPPSKLPSTSRRTATSRAVPAYPSAGSNATRWRARQARHRLSAL